MIAFHYPPMKGSSGLQRTLNFTQYLPAHGWEPRLITVSPRAYPATSGDQLSDIPSGLQVRRLACLDASRHLAVRGRYPGLLALPDRWVSWLLTAVPVGLLECVRWKPDLIWSTFPIPTAIVIGALLARLSGRPWVVDLRDSMTEDNYPTDARVRRLLRRIEATAVRRARAVVFTSPGARRMYASRYPEVSDSRWAEISNGYDEESFRHAEQTRRPDTPKPAASLQLVHSGLLDPVDRNPVPFLQAVARLKRLHAISSAVLRITLRATGHDPLYCGLIKQLDIGDIIELVPPIAYLDALREMLDASALIVFQAGNCNHQIPAKLYEYLRAGKPVFGVTDQSGDTAAALRAAGFPGRYLASIEDSAEIESQLIRFLTEVRSEKAVRPDPARIRGWSRAGQSETLAALFDRVASA